MEAKIHNYVPPRLVHADTVFLSTTLWGHGVHVVPLPGVLISTVLFTLLCTPGALLRSPQTLLCTRKVGMDGHSMVSSVGFTIVSVMDAISLFCSLDPTLFPGVCIVYRTCRLVGVARSP